MQSRDIVSGSIGFGFGLLVLAILLFNNAHNSFENNSNITLSEWYGFEKEGK